MSALAEVAPALLDQGRLNDALALVRSTRSEVVRARGYVVLAAASEIALEQALRESRTGPDVHDDASGDWIAALCETASRYVAEDEQLSSQAVRGRARDVRRGPGSLFRIASAGNHRARARPGRLVQRRSRGRTRGWGQAANSTSAPRAPKRLGWSRMRWRAWAAATRRAAATEADEIATQAVMSALSLAPMMPPDGFESQNRRRVERFLADADEPRSGEKPSTAQMDDRRPEPAQRTGESSDLLNAPGLDDFLVALANRATHDVSRAALLSLKEATRIAGWTSRTWRTVSEAISTPA